MNEFTLEELEDMHELLEEECKEYHMYNDNDEDLEEYWIPFKNKIKSMIDLYDAKVIPVWHCEKCGHVQ